MIEQSFEVKKEEWTIVERPGYLGSKRNQKYDEWNEKYGKGNWQIGYQLADGQKVNFDYIFHLYCLGYMHHFFSHPEEAEYITQNFSFTFDETRITYDQAFDPFYLVDKPSVSNQFHHVAINQALVELLGWNFKGKYPLQIRMGKSNVPQEAWPKGWKWHPGRIAATAPHLIPKDVYHQRKWWDNGSIEDLYQSSKVLEVKLA